MSPNFPQYKAPKGTKTCSCPECKHLKGLAAYQKSFTVNNHLKKYSKSVSVWESITILQPPIYTYVYKLATETCESDNGPRNAINATSNGRHRGHGDWA